MNKLAGGILQAVGILIAGASGLCSLAVIFSVISSIISQPGDFGILILVALFGGIPLIIGIALFRWGRAIVRSADERIDDTFD